MKVTAFNGSARKNGNTATLIGNVLEVLKENGIETEHVQLGGSHLKGCIACYKCFEKQNRRCSVKDDYLNEALEKMESSDGIILGSPTYFANVSTNTKSLIERAGLVAKANNDMFARKAGAAVVAVRRSGAIHTFSAINQFFLISGMVVPGSTYWNIGIGMDPGDAAGDAEGVQTMKNLGANMAWLLERIR